MGWRSNRKILIRVNNITKQICLEKNISFNEAKKLAFKKIKEEKNLPLNELINENISVW